MSETWDAEQIARVWSRYRALDVSMQRLSGLSGLSDLQQKALFEELMSAARTVPMLLEEVKRLRRALAWYADASNYEQGWNMTPAPTPASSDQGSRA